MNYYTEFSANINIKRWNNLVI